MEFKNTKVFGIKDAVITAGLPMSTDYAEFIEEANKNIEARFCRAHKLGSCKVGTGHDSFLKGIKVQVDVKYTQFWSMQFQRYHFSDIISSQSKMHRLTEMGLTEENTNGHIHPEIVLLVNEMIDDYNDIKENEKMSQKRNRELHDLFLTILSSCPMGFMLWMRLDLNYLQLKTIYLQRRNTDARRLPDWKEFCEWCESLPNFLYFIGESYQMEVNFG